MGSMGVSVEFTFPIDGLILIMLKEYNVHFFDLHYLVDFIK